MRTPGRLAWAALLGLALDADPAHACSFIGRWASRDTTQLAMLVRSSGDTIAVGAGRVAPVAAMGHFGVGIRDGLHGQWLDVVELPPRSAARLPSGVRRVIMVPWDYGADCRPVRWSRSARWLPTDRTLLVRGELRAPEHWTDGVPTFDVRVPQLAVYDPVREAEEDSTGVAPLEPRHLMHLIDSLPPSGRTTDTLAEREVLLRLHATPALRDSPQMRWVISNASYALNSARMRQVRPPFAGTTRLEFSLDDGPWRTAWMRTDPSVVVPFRDDEDRPPPKATDPLSPLPFDGYEMRVWLAESVDALLTDCEDDRPIASSYVALRRHAPNAHRAAGRWWVHFEPGLLRAAIADTGSARRQTGMPDWPPDYDIAVTRRRRGGRARIEGETTLDGVGRIRMRGVQVDTVTVACTPP